MIKRLNITIMTLFALDYSWFSHLFPTAFLVFIEKVTEMGSQLFFLSFESVTTNTHSK